MADERRVLQSILGSVPSAELMGLDAAGRPRSLDVRIRGAWLDAGLPVEPEDGLDGLQQLRIAVELLRQWVVAGQSLASLLDYWTLPTSGDRQLTGVAFRHQVDGELRFIEPLSSAERSQVEGLATLVAQLDQFISEQSRW